MMSAYNGSKRIRTDPNAPVNQYLPSDGQKNVPAPRAPAAMGGETDFVKAHAKVKSAPFRKAYADGKAEETLA